MNGTVLEVLKWMGVVFAAGFVGYFGRHLAATLIDRLRRKKPAQPRADSTGEVPAHPPGTASDAAAAAQAKIEKKRAKAEAKRVKKERG